MLGVGMVLRLVLAGYALSGKSATMAAVAWHGDAMLSAVQSAVAWYLSWLLVRVFGIHAALYAACAAVWMAGLLAFWVPELVHMLGLPGRERGSMCGATQAERMPWQSREARWQGRLRIALAVLPLVAVLASMWHNVLPAPS